MFEISRVECTLMFSGLFHRLVLKQPWYVQLLQQSLTELSPLLIGMILATE